MEGHQVIPDEAVEAAAKAMFLYRSRSNGPDLGHIWDAEMNEDLKSIFKAEAQTTLEAAAPHLIRQAQAEAWDLGIRTGSPGTAHYYLNPYRKDEDAL
jgi:hypothetical protein